MKEENLFAVNRERDDASITLGYDFFMSNYPHFDTLPTYTFSKEGSSISMSTRPVGDEEALVVTAEDYKLIHRYITSTKEFEPNEYSRICELSKHIAISKE